MTGVGLDSHRAGEEGGRGERCWHKLPALHNTTSVDNVLWHVWRGFFVDGSEGICARVAESGRYLESEADPHLEAVLVQPDSP